MFDEITSREIETLEDEISGEFCECSHEINEHYVGEITGTSKCNALMFNGSVYSGCRCSKLKVREFCIKVMVPNAENSQIAA